MKDLGTRASLAVALVVLAMALLLFVPAASVRYLRAWVYLATFTGDSALMTADLLKNDPALLERRMRAGPTAEQRPAQRVIMLCVPNGVAALLVGPGLDHRFRWSLAWIIHER